MLVLGGNILINTWLEMLSFAWLNTWVPCSTSFSMATSVPPSSTQKLWADVQFFPPLGSLGIFTKRHYEQCQKHSFLQFYNELTISQRQWGAVLKILYDFLGQKWLLLSLSCSKGVKVKTKRTSFQSESMPSSHLHQAGTETRMCFVMRGYRNNVSCSMKNSMPFKTEPAWLQSL